MLTKKQHDLLLYIHEKLQESDIPPSFEEMKDAIDLKSKSGVHRLITALVERGYISRLPHRARALEIVRLPEGLKKKQTANLLPAVNSKDMGLSQIPLYGRIAAGTPIEAIQDSGVLLSLPPDMISKGDHYALTVDGDSMIKAGIHDKDTVVIRRCDTAENGSIVVALIDDLEVTLKRLRRAGNKIVLEPENDAYEPRIFEPKRVKIQGKLAGLIRTYH